MAEEEGVEEKQVSWWCAGCGESIDEKKLSDEKGRTAIRSGEPFFYFFRNLRGEIIGVTHIVLPSKSSHGACGPCLKVCAGGAPLTTEMLFAETRRALHSAFPDRAEEMYSELLIRVGHTTNHRSTYVRYVRSTGRIHIVQGADATHTLCGYDAGSWPEVTRDENIHVWNRRPHCRHCQQTAAGTR